MLDYRLKVFMTVAKRLSFTKAASELFITQPAVTSHIRELEAEYKVKLFERKANKILLTPAGKLLVKHGEDIFSIYRTLEFELNTIAQRHKGTLRLGASTTVAQYVVPSILAEFHQKFKEVSVDLINGNTTQIEQRLLHKEIELGIIEGRSKNQEIKYTKFLRDEIVLVAKDRNPWLKKNEIKPADLLKLPLVFREQGSGTLEVIDYALRPHKIRMNQLNVEMYLGSTESIKSYLLHSNCLAFVSIHSVSKELHRGELRVLDIKGLSIERDFYFIHLQGKAEPLPEMFMRFALQSENHQAF